VRSNRFPTRPVFLALLGAALTLAACGGGATPPPSFPPGAIVITAENRTFSTDELVVPAGQKFPLVLVNKDSDAHNIAIRTKQGFDGDVVFRHDPVTATTVVLEAGPIPAGTYYFICEVHPNMTGTVLATGG
jgi:plastocyanin